jgi:hypothetical protein
VDSDAPFLAAAPAPSNSFNLIFKVYCINIFFLISVSLAARAQGGSHVCSVGARTHAFSTAGSACNELANRRRNSFPCKYMPSVLESADLRGYDLLHSSESGPVKGVMAPSQAEDETVWSFHESRSTFPLAANLVSGIVSNA